MTEPRLVYISKGVYDLNSTLKLSVNENIELISGMSYDIKGENGSGKSSFVRNILFKEVSKQCKGIIQYLYFDQEILSQFYYGKAYLSVKEHRGIKKIDDLILAIIKLHTENNIYGNENFILILDETDKYISTSKLVSYFLTYKLTLINISHKQTEGISFEHKIIIKKIDELNSTLENQ